MDAVASDDLVRLLVLAMVWGLAIPTTTMPSNRDLKDNRYIRSILRGQKAHHNTLDTVGKGRKFSENTIDTEIRARKFGESTSAIRFRDEETKVDTRGYADMQISSNNPSITVSSQSNDEDTKDVKSKKHSGNTKEIRDRENDNCTVDTFVKNRGLDQNITNASEGKKELGNNITVRGFIASTTVSSSGIIAETFIKSQRLLGWHNNRGGIRSYNGSKDIATNSSQIMAGVELANEQRPLITEELNTRPLMHSMLLLNSHLRRRRFRLAEDSAPISVAQSSKLKLIPESAVSHSKNTSLNETADQSRTGLSAESHRATGTESVIFPTAVSYRGSISSGERRQKVCGNVHTAANATVLNIIGLFAMDGPYPGGLGYLLAALLAVQHINSNPGILPGYSLRINVYNTGCSEPQGLNSLYKEIFNPNRTSIMTLGGTCSHVTEATARVSRLWGLTQISYSAISPHLSNKELFPWFFRVMTPEQNLTIARIKMFTALNWTRIHVIYENYKLFSTLNEYLKEDLRNAGIEVSSEMFTTDPTLAVMKLKEKDARIIIGSFYEIQARKVMCALYDQDQLQGPTAWYRKIVWFLPSFFDHHWMHVAGPTPGCTPEKIKQVVGRYFTVGSVTIWNGRDYDGSPGILATKNVSSILGSRELYRTVREDIPKELQGYYQYIERNPDASLYAQHRAPEAYDAVWAIAWALNNTLTHLIDTHDPRCLEDFDYKNESFSELLHSAMENVNFSAVSGPFFFNDKGERALDVDIQIYNNDYQGQFTTIGQCRPRVNENWTCDINLKRIQWEQGRAPVDGVHVVQHVLTINPRIKYSFWMLAFIGVILSCMLLVFNISKRNHRIIKMSSPHLNNVILMGCMMAYSTVLLLDTSSFGGTCVIQPFFVVLSFSLSFGALFVKTWRVYNIFTAGSRMLNTRMLRDSSLFCIITALVVVNSLILVGWVLASPQMHRLNDVGKPSASENEDILLQNQFQQCDSKYRIHFMVALITVQGMVMLFGIFLAIQTRKVTFPELNDSRWIAMCIYNVVVMSSIGIFVYLATEEKPEMSFSLGATILILVTFVTQCLIFVPKIRAYRIHNRTQGSQLTRNPRQVNQVNKILNIYFMEKQFPHTTHLKIGNYVDGENVLTENAECSVPPDKPKEADTGPMPQTSCSSSLKRSSVKTTARLTLSSSARDGDEHSQSSLKRTISEADLRFAVEENKLDTGHSLSFELKGLGKHSVDMVKVRTDFQVEENNDFRNNGLQKQNCYTEHSISNTCLST